MPHNISLNNITPMTAPAQQELSDISLQTTASVLPRVETQPNMSEPALPQTPRSLIVVSRMRKRPQISNLK